MEDSVKSLMNSQVISVLPSTPILMTIDIIINNNFNGIPVTDKEGRLAGIITKYDLIAKRNYIRDDMTTGDVMNKEPLVLEENMTINDAIRAFTEHHRVDPIPVIDADKKVIGIISRYDMVRLFREYGSSFIDKSPSAKGRRNVLGFFLALVIVISASLVYYLFFF